MAYAEHGLHSPPETPVPCQDSQPDQVSQPDTPVPSWPTPGTVRPLSLKPLHPQDSHPETPLPYLSNPCTIPLSLKPMYEPKTPVPPSA